MAFRRRARGPSDEDLVRLIARDLEQELERRSSALADVYAVALWVDEVYGEFGVCIATEREFNRLLTFPGYQAPRELLYAPSGVRWSIGDWEVNADQFISDLTRQALAPLKRQAEDMDLDEAIQDVVFERLREIGHAVLQVARPLDFVPTTSDAIVFAEPGGAGRVSTAESMQRTVSPDQFHRLFPAWRRLAAEVRAVRADRQRMLELERLVAEAINTPTAFPRGNEPSPDELTEQLRACGMWWWHVTTWNEDLERALAIADRD